MISKLAKVFGVKDKALYRARKVRRDASQYNFTAINMRFNKVKGFFKEAHVEVDFNIYELDDSFLNIRWPVSGIRSGIPERDQQLINAPHFFNGQEYPEIVFKSRSIVKETKDQLIVTGDLFIKEHRKTIALYVGYQVNKIGYQLFIDYSLDRFEFGIGENGSFSIGRQIELEFDLFLEFETNS